MERIKRYFEYWDMDGVVFTHFSAIFLSVVVFVLATFGTDVHIPSGWLWQYTVLAIIIAVILIHVIIIGTVQSKFCLTRPSGHQFATIVIKDDGGVIELTKPALWGKGRLVKILWKDGYKYRKDSGAYREESITLSWILTHKIENITVSVPLCINMKVSGYINPVELFRILLNNQPNAITAGKDLSVDIYFKSIIHNIAEANNELIDNQCKEYLDNKISESGFMAKLTKDLIIDNIVFPNSKVTEYYIEQPEVSAHPKQ